MNANYEDSGRKRKSLVFVENCTSTGVVYTIQEASPCAKTKRMQMKVKVKVKMFGQRFRLWRSFQQAPISFHFIQWI
jgi:hypothetical protein